MASDSFPAEALSNFPPGGAVSSFGLYVPSNPVLRVPCFGLGRLSFQLGKAGLLELVLVQLVRIRVAVRRSLGVRVCYFIAFNPSVCRGNRIEREHPLSLIASCCCVVGLSPTDSRLHTPSTTTCIARKHQGSSVTPILGVYRAHFGLTMRMW